MTSLSFYYLALLTTPSPLVVYLIHCTHHPRLLALHKYLKSIIRIFKGSEIHRILMKEIARCAGTAVLTDAHRIWKGDIATITLWRINQAIQLSKVFADERLALRFQSLTKDAIQDLASSVSRVKGVDEQEPSFALLDRCLSHINSANIVIQTLTERALVPCDTTKAEHKDLLHLLWKLLKPEETLEDLKSKQWQDLGFQGKDPSTDFRATGIVGLECMIAFAQFDNEADLKDPKALVKDAVNGGAGWYPWAIVSIAITDFVLSELKQGNLNWILLSAIKSTSHTQAQNCKGKSREGEEEPITNRGVETITQVTVILAHHFHEHWLYLLSNPVESKRPNVMQFEKVFGKWKVEISRWLVRGRIGGWVDGRGFEEWDFEEDIQQDRKDR